MKTLFRASLIAASAATFSLSSHAQVLTENTLGAFDAASSWTTGFALDNDKAVTQTFNTGVGVVELGSLTFRFIAQSTDVFSATMLDVAVSEWTGGSAAVTAQAGGEFFGINALSIADNTGWETDGSFQYFDATIDLSSVTSLTASTTYGISLIGTAGTDSLIRVASGNADYANGAGFTQTGVFVPALLENGSGTAFTGITGDFLFSASSVGGSGFAAVPEASSVAVLFAGLFVGNLMFLRSRRRPVAAA